jgi:hypothetical protein
MLRSVLLIFSSITFSFLQAQDINGAWKGKLVMEPGGCYPVYYIEMHLQKAGTRIMGTSYQYEDTANYVKQNIEGIVLADSSKFQVNETGIITFHIPGDCVPCTKKFELGIYKGETLEEQLRGSWSGHTIDGKTVCPSGTILLSRLDKPLFDPGKKLPVKLTGRSAELVKIIKVDTGVITLDFYDNGQIDGDTISVYVNGKAVVINKMLREIPISMSIKVDLKNKEQEVIMVGENLGTIPPNTALMIVHAGDMRYELFLSSDEQKNAMVRFIYEKPPDK